MTIVLGSGGPNGSSPGHAPALSELLVRSRVRSIDELLQGDKVSITLHGRSFKFPAGLHYTAYVRGVDTKRGIVTLSPFQSRFLRKLLPPTVVVDVRQQSADGWLHTYYTDGGADAFDKYIVAA